MLRPHAVSGLRAWAVIITLGSSFAAAEDGVSPPALVHASPATWPEDGGVGGDVELLLTIDDTGKVRDIEVQSSPGDAFTDSAISAARGLVFEPATLDGGAVGVVLAYRYHFEQAVQDAGLPPGRLVGTVMTKGTRDVVPLAQVSFGDAGVETGRFEIEIPSGRWKCTSTPRAMWSASSRRRSPRDSGRKCSTVSSARIRDPTRRS